ncbi:hypothetical protein FRB94_004655 [Tulasnella sp. JGI-2019a]|nr:hypothetical protein FRB93_013468 [Tulasnella sp. JGI-2019a]KAG9001564.1 hypothetical protein FRB94_004655 [Tulasnella sp. JGI-2019a]
MMLTPKFSCSQTGLSVIISLYVPSIRASEVEIHVEGSLFSIHINPYFLRLHLPGNVLEDDESSAKYDPGSGYLIVTLTKEHKGEDFRDLDMLAKLLVPPGVRDNEREDVYLRIEVIGGSSHGVTNHAGGEPTTDMMEKLTQETGSMGLGEGAVEAVLDLEKERATLLEAKKHDWHYPQAFADSNASATTGQSASASLAGVTRPYGFLDSYNGYFKYVTYSDNEVNELGPDAEHLTMEERRVRRETREDEKWDSKYYLADYANDEDIQELIHWRSPYDPSNNPSGEVEFTEEENTAILRLSGKEYLITPAQTQALYFTLVNILFSYAYDLRTTQNDPTPESAWTICSLTPAFSALDTSTSTLSSQLRSPVPLTTTLIASYRRALAFPLYRNWNLCEKCKQDVVDILSGGRRVVIRALLRLKMILDRHETYYIYSKIWVNDYVVWIQAYASDKGVSSLASLLQVASVPKYALGWDLKELEDSTLGLKPDSDDEDEPDDPSLLPGPL